MAKNVVKRSMSVSHVGKPCRRQVVVGLCFCAENETDKKRMLATLLCNKDSKQL